MQLIIQRKGGRGVKEREEGGVQVRERGHLP